MRPFEDHFKTIIAQANLKKRSLTEGECQSPRSSRCSLCHAIDLEYEDEIRLKNQALRSFWEQFAFTKTIAQLVPSPLGRGYRTVTKRRAFKFRDSVKLGLITPTDEGSYKPFDVVRCAIEPAGHAPIYQRVQDILEKPYAGPIGDALGYAIIKGSYTEYTLILNVREMSPEVVHATNTLSKSLTHSFKEIVGIFLYEDTSDGRYYLGSSNRKPIAFRKIFGKAEIYQRMCGKSFLYSPLSFSQVNMSIAEQFVTKAGELLGPTKEMRLTDLYCGYGLFALCLAESADSAVGVEIAVDSVASAIANAKRQKASNVRFVRSDITSETIPRLMAHARQQDVVLLDPPRSGTGVAVIECIAARKPARVLHIFCNVDIMPAELKRWEASGYMVEKAIPFDMFPGTPSVEMMVLLTGR
jgi:tRNA/tmRNA/rRNA uracil-C5-methylase (TrmA/RlmC/RlmD family)